MSLQILPGFTQYIPPKNMIRITGINAQDIEYTGSIPAAYGLNLEYVLQQLDNRVHDLFNRVSALESECLRLNLENENLRNQLYRLPQAQIEI